MFSGVYFSEDHTVQALTGACEQQFGRVQGDAAKNARPNFVVCFSVPLIKISGTDITTNREKPFALEFRWMQTLK